jgi:hypothetical protein
LVSKKKDRNRERKGEKKGVTTAENFRVILKMYMDPNKSYNPT